MYSTRQLTSWFRRPWQSTLATKTATFTSVLFLVAILAVGVASLQSFGEQLVNVIIAEQNTVVERIADNLDQKLLSLQKTLALSAAEITDADVASSDAAQHYLDNNTGLYATVDRSLFLFSGDGHVLAERPLRLDRRGEDGTWRQYISETMRTRRPVISEPFLTNAGDANMVLVMTMPVISKDGRLIGILTGSLGLTHPGMLGNIAKTVIGKTGYLYIVTADGKLIMHPNRALLSERAFVPTANPLFESALKGFEGTKETVDWQGRPALVSFKRVMSSNWIVAAVYPKDEALAVIHDLIWRFVDFLLLACLVVVVAIGVLTQHLMRPLVVLTHHLTTYAGSDARIAPLVGAKGSGEIQALRTAFNQLTARLHDREDALIETSQKYQLITENSTDLITQHARDGTIIYASSVSSGILGMDQREMVGHSLFEFVHPEDFKLVRTAMDEVVGLKSLPTIIYRARHVDQHYVWFETTLRLMKSATGEDTETILCVSRNISDRKLMEERLHSLARTDHLTTLPNRVLLDERFASGLVQARREGSLLAMLMVDIDRFKNINDTLGHGVGDALLKLIGATLKLCIRDCDTIARWGGDEFVLLLPGLQDSNIAVLVAQRCLKALKEPFIVEGHTLRVSGSIGISLSQDSSTGSEILLQHADTAMYKAKARGGDCSTLYSPDMSVGARTRLSMENQLFHAIERQELLLHYQPLISAKTGRIVGVEALIRWQHPELGLVPPGQFIPIAEESGLIVAIGEWVLRTACRQMNEWYGQGLPRIPISVNLSSRQFRQDDLVGTVKSVLDDTAFDAELLELELTESLLMDDVQHSKVILARLKALGVTIALDDFGTGYSSLSYLKGFQLDTLKIDRTFVAEVMTSQENASIVCATINLAKGLRLRTVGEGVETREQANFLVKQGCDVLQGFLFARPMESQAFLSFAMASHTYLLPKTAKESNELLG